MDLEQYPHQTTLKLMDAAAQVASAWLKWSAIPSSGKTNQAELEFIDSLHELLRTCRALAEEQVWDIVSSPRVGLPADPATVIYEYAGRLARAWREWPTAAAVAYNTAARPRLRMGDTLPASEAAVRTALTELITVIRSVGYDLDAR